MNEFLNFDSVFFQQDIDDGELHTISNESILKAPPDFDKDGDYDKKCFVLLTGTDLNERFSGFPDDFSIIIRLDIYDLEHIEGWKEYLDPNSIISISDIDTWNDLATNLTPVLLGTSIITNDDAIYITPSNDFYIDIGNDESADIMDYLDKQVEGTPPMPGDLYFQLDENGRLATIVQGELPLYPFNP